MISMICQVPILRLSSYESLQSKLRYPLPEPDLRVISDLGLRPPVGSILQFAPANSGLKVPVRSSQTSCWRNPYSAPP